MFNEKEKFKKRIFPLKLTQVAKKATEALRENHHLRKEKNFEKRKRLGNEIKENSSNYV